MDYVLLYSCTFEEHKVFASWCKVVVGKSFFQSFFQRAMALSASTGGGPLRGGSRHPCTWHCMLPCGARHAAPWYDAMGPKVPEGVPSSTLIPLQNHHSSTN